MRLLLLGAGFACLAVTPATSNGLGYQTAPLMERDRVEVIYLPNNTCHIGTPSELPVENYKDFVRACLNNRHLRSKIGDPLAN